MLFLLGWLQLDERSSQAVLVAAPHASYRICKVLENLEVYAVYLFKCTSVVAPLARCAPSFGPGFHGTARCSLLQLITRSMERCALYKLGVQ